MTSPAALAWHWHGVAGARRSCLSGVSVPGGAQTVLVLLLESEMPVLELSSGVAWVCPQDATLEVGTVASTTPFQGPAAHSS